MKNKNETVRLLRVNYTDAERLELGKKLAGVYQDLDQTNHDFDSVKTDFKARITAHEAKITDFAHKVANGFRIEEVKCLWKMDRPTAGSKQLVRIDLCEVVETEEMTQADKQGELPLQPLSMADIKVTPESPEANA